LARDVREVYRGEVKEEDVVLTAGCNLVSSTFLSKSSLTKAEHRRAKASEVEFARKKRLVPPFRTITETLLRRTLADHPFSSHYPFRLSTRP